MNGTTGMGDWMTLWAVIGDAGSAAWTPATGTNAVGSPRDTTGRRAGFSQEWLRASDR